MKYNKYITKMSSTCTRLNHSTLYLLWLFHFILQFCCVFFYFSSVHHYSTNFGLLTFQKLNLLVRYNKMDLVRYSQRCSACYQRREH